MIAINPVGEIDYEIVKDNAGSMALTWNEVMQFMKYFREREWRDCIKDTISNNEENLCFDEMTEDEFVGECIATLDDMYSELKLDPDYDSVVFDVAEDNDVWRE